MAFCPSCGKEQRCGCEECHDCGATLIGHRPTPSGAVPLITANPPDLPAREPAKKEEGAYFKGGASPAAEHSGVTGRLLPAALIVIGVAVLVVGIVEILHTSAGIGPGAAASLKRLGYYLAGLLYISSVRALVGFGAITAALLISPPRPFSRKNTWKGASSAAGMVMILVGLLYYLSILMMFLPGRQPEIMVRHLMPSLPGAILVLVVVGAALIVAGRQVAMAPAYVEEEAGPHPADEAKPKGLAALRGSFARKDGGGKT